MVRINPVAIALSLVLLVSSALWSCAAGESAVDQLFSGARGSSVGEAEPGQGASWDGPAEPAAAATELRGGVRSTSSYTTSRVSEPIILTGDQLAPLIGTAKDNLWLITSPYDGEQWWPEIQLDERDGSGNIVPQEDGELDENDLVVFMADHLGQRSTPYPPEWADFFRVFAAVEVRVTDPLDPAYEGYGYVCRAETDLGLDPGYLVRYDTQTAEVISDRYTLGLASAAADGFVGLKRLSLFDDPTDLLDRVKLRARAGVWPLLLKITEDDLGELGLDFAPDPVKTAGVRVVMDSGAAASAYYGRVTLIGGIEDVPLPPGIQASDVRVSLDMSPAASSARYRDANTPAGVTIDGEQDEVASSPLPEWREIVFETGRVVLLGTGSTAAADAEVYYKDDDRPDGEDTGDGLSYGDNGVSADDLDSLIGAGFPGVMVVLPPDSELTPEDLLAQARTPLQVEVIALPTATPDPARPTDTPTSMPTDSPSPTATSTRATATAIHGGLPWRIALPLAIRVGAPAPSGR